MTTQPDPDYREGRVGARDGLSLYYRAYGPRRSDHVPLLCLGGLTRNSKDFHGLATREAARRLVISSDYRGRGRSEYDRDWRNYHPGTYLDDIRHILIALDVHSVVVVGTSLGGLLAAVMTAALPTVIKGAVLNDVGPEINRGALAPIVDYLANPPAFRAWEDAAAHIRAAFPDFPASTDEDWLVIAQLTYKQDPDGLIRFDWDPEIVRPIMKDTTERHDFWPLFRGFGDRPVLAVRGERSDILSRDTFDAMAEALPRLSRVSVPDVGHAPSLNEPEAREALDGFLDGL